MAIEKICGVYQIVNLVNGKIYVGSSQDCWKRWQQHRTDMGLQRHHSRHLNGAWLKYGNSAFEFRIIEVVAEKHALISREQFWIDATNCWDRRIGYNKRRVADSSLGVRHSAETRAKISALQKGKKIPPETKIKMSSAQMGIKKSQSHARNISAAQMLFKGDKLDELLKLRASGMGVQALAAHFGCGRHVVQRTLCGRQTAIGKEIDPIDRGARPTGRFSPGQSPHNKKLGEKELSEIAELRRQKVMWRDICAVYGTNIARTVNTFKEWERAQQD